MADTAKERALAELKDEQDRKKMGEAYDKATFRPPKPPAPASAASSPEKLKVMTKAKGGCTKMAKGGSVSSASKRADGCATKGKTNCKVY